MSVVEPAIENSGIPQGKLIKRQRLPKNDLGDCWHWKDLNLDMDVTLYGKVFHIYNCDQWTAVSKKNCMTFAIGSLIDVAQGFMHLYYKHYSNCLFISRTSYTLNL